MSKRNRIVWHHVSNLFSTNSYSEDVALNNVGVEFFNQFIRLKNGRVVTLNEGGINSLRVLADKIEDSGVYEGKVDFNDIFHVCRRLLIEWIENRVMPSDVDEFFCVFDEAMRREIKTFSFIVSLYGIELEGLDSLPLGQWTIVRPSKDYLVNLGVDKNLDHFDSVFRRVCDDGLWLSGKVTATRKVAERNFFLHARLLAGVLAIWAAASYVRGAETFRLGIATSPEERGHTSNTVICIEEGSAYLGFTQQVPRGSALKIESKMAEDFQGDGVYSELIRILQKYDKSSLEQAIERAVFWFSDAQRDVVPVMRYVKYWSCIETFFSNAGNTDITKSISIGTAVVLLSGPLQHIVSIEYRELKRKISKMYQKRSKAVHAGVHDHVTMRDLESLSQWAAWLILSMSVFSCRYESVGPILDWCLKVDSERP